MKCKQFNYFIFFILHLLFIVIPSDVYDTNSIASSCALIKSVFFYVCEDSYQICSQVSTRHWRFTSVCFYRLLPVDGFVLCLSALTAPLVHKRPELSNM